MPSKDDKATGFFKQTWVQIVSTIIAAALGGLITFFATTNSGKAARADEDHDKLIKVESDGKYTKEQVDKFAAQFGELKGVVDELKWTARSLEKAVEELKKE
jgi:peptidoglycan hydrolase CwlO-like protein